MAVTRVRPGTSANPPRTSQAQPGGVQKGVASVTTPKPPKGPTKVGQVGTPGGTLPKNPTEGQSYTGSGGVHWQYNTAKGGWVRVPVAPGTVTTQSRPSATPSITPTEPTVPSAPTTTTTPFKPDSGWWTQQFSADPRWLQNAPGFRAAEEGLGAKYGYQIQRSSSGQPMFRKPKRDEAGKVVTDPTTGQVVYEATGITQAVDASGNPILSDTGAFQYKDAQGNTYSPADLEMDIRELQPGQAGYLEGQLGGTAAASAVRQQDVGEAAAKAGVGRSGMRAYGAASETQALQSALRNLGVSAASEFGGLSQQQRNLFNTIYADLAKSAREIPPTETTTPGTTIPPAPTTTAGAGRGEYGGVQVPQKPLASEKTMSIAGQSVTFPKGINLAGVNVEAIGKRIAGNVAAVGGVGKLKPGQRVGEFRAGDKGYRVFYRGGRFVIEAIG